MVETFDVASTRNDFDIIAFESTTDNPFVYLDSAATTLKPNVVIDAISHFYRHDYANVHRSLYTLGGRASDAYENARLICANFIAATTPAEIIFTKNATEGLNLVASGLTNQVTSDCAILVSASEHHSNLIPWQQLCSKTGAQLKIINLLPSGIIDIEHLKQLLDQKTVLVAITAISNIIGVLNPIKEITSLAHKHNALVMVDGAQAAPHIPININEWGCDFMSISGHKCYGPSGASFVYIKESVVELLDVYQTGGSMVREVTYQDASYLPAPTCFEAGTPPIAEVVGLGAALKYMSSLTLEKIHAYETEILRYMIKCLARLPYITIYGDTSNKIGLVAFNMDKVHPHDIATLLNDHNIAIRAGHHCAIPLHQYLNIHSSVRASVGIYNNKNDIDRLIKALEQIAILFKVI